MNTTLLWPSDLPTLIIFLAEKPTRQTDRQCDRKTARVTDKWRDRTENDNDFPCKRHNNREFCK